MIPEQAPIDHDDGPMIDLNFRIVSVLQLAQGARENLAAAERKLEQAVELAHSLGEFYGSHVHTLEGVAESVDEDAGGLDSFLDEFNAPRHLANDHRRRFDGQEIST